MEIKVKNREWVKNAAIIFLAVLLVLTFFSNTIMNRSLPEVATQMVSDGAITAKVRGTGTVTANGLHEVKATQTREIRAVMIKSGQEVVAGDVLFVLGAGDSAELEAAEDQLRQLQSSYNSTAISNPGFDMIAYNAKRDAAIAERDAAEAAVGKAQTNYTEGIKNSESEALTQAKSRLDDAIARRDACSKKYTFSLEPTKKLYDNPYLELQEPDSTQPNGIKINVDITKLSTTLADLVYKRDAAKSAIPTNEVVAAEISSALAEKDAKQATLDDLLQNNPDSDEAIRVAEAALATATENLKVAQTRQANAQAAYENAVKAVKEQANSDIVSAPDLTNAQAEVEKRQTEYEALTAGTIYAQELAKANENLLAAIEKVSSIEEEKKNYDRSQASVGVTLTDLAVQINKQKEKIKELSGEEADQIVANVAGTVESISCTAGDTKAKDDVLCTIEVPDMGYTLSFSVTNDQAKRLRTGNVATVSNYYWGTTINATLTNIKTDPKSPQSNKLLTFDLSGDVTAGAELTLSVGDKSANYDIIIPNSAIRSDTNGSFVLMVQAKNSPLGNRYIAQRVAIEVIASDDSNSAVTAALEYGDYVITTSNAPISSGDQVRMADT